MPTAETLRAFIRDMRDEANATDTSEEVGEGYADACETWARRLEAWVDKHIGDR